MFVQCVWFCELTSYLFLNSFQFIALFPSLYITTFFLVLPLLLSAALRFSTYTLKSWLFLFRICIMLTLLHLYIFIFPPCFFFQVFITFEHLHVFSYFCVLGLYFSHYISPLPEPRLYVPRLVSAVFVSHNVSFLELTSTRAMYFIFLALTVSWCYLFFFFLDLLFFYSFLLLIFFLFFSFLFSSFFSFIYLFFFLITFLYYLPLSFLFLKFYFPLFHHLFFFLFFLFFTSLFISIFSFIFFSEIARLHFLVFSFLFSPYKVLSYYHFFHIFPVFTFPHNLDPSRGWEGEREEWMRRGVEQDSKKNEVESGGLEEWNKSQVKEVKGMERWAGRKWQTGRGLLENRLTEGEEIKWMSKWTAMD